MGKKLLRYAIYNANGVLVFEGDAESCAKHIGAPLKSFRNSMYGKPSKEIRGYLVVDISDETELEKGEKTMQGAAAAIAAWDAFVTPIRERYGIPVYKGGKSDGT